MNVVVRPSKLRIAWQCFSHPPHFHHLPPTVIAVSTTTQAETASERTKLGRVFRAWTPTSLFLLLFSPSSFLLCVSGTIYMLSSAGALKRCSKSRPLHPLDLTINAQGVSAKGRTATLRHLAALTSGGYKVLEIVENVEGKLWSWREGKACWTNRALWPILIALRIWEGKASKRIQFLISASTSQTVLDKAGLTWATLCKCRLIVWLYFLLILKRSLATCLLLFCCCCFLNRSSVNPKKRASMLVVTNLSICISKLRWSDLSSACR